VFDDDRVIRYTGAEDDTGDAEDAQMTKWGLAGIRVRDFAILSFMLLNFGTCNTFVITIL